MPTGHLRRCVTLAALLAVAAAVRPRPAAAAPPDARAWQPDPDDRKRAPRPLEDPSGRALDPFFARLARVDDDLPGALVRVTHLGDSSIGLDGLTHAIRRRMQGRFGDGGPGFVLLQRYSPNYRSRAVTHRSNGGWEFCYIAYLCQADGHYGLGGVSFTSEGGASTKVIPVADDGGLRSAELWYAAIPHGGRIRVTLDGTEPHVVDTRAEALEDRWHEFRLAPGTRDVEVTAMGRVRAYGLVLETDGPGVVWDGMSMVGAFTRRLGAWDAEHIAEQLSHRGADLLVLSYGGNDLRRVVAGRLSAGAYEREYDAVLGKLLADRGDMACLLTSVIDHGRSGQYEVDSRHVELIVDAQRRVAARHGCAFFDSYEAMGGEGSMMAWRERTPPLTEPDLKHLNARGRDRMGDYIYRALVAGYVDWRIRQGQAAPPTAAAP
jgi:lysophospholipase L1-like esterase